MEGMGLDQEEGEDGRVGLDQEGGEDGPVCGGQIGRQRKEADISQSTFQV